MPGIEEEKSQFKQQTPDEAYAALKDQYLNYRSSSQPSRDFIQDTTQLLTPRVGNNPKLLLSNSNEMSMSSLQEEAQQTRDSFGQPQQTKVDFYTARTNSNIFLETSKEMEIRVKKQSAFKHLTTWKMAQFIVKSNDDVRQE